MSDRIVILGLLGASGSGKSVVAQHLVAKHGFARVRFAQPIKDMLRAIGLSEMDVDGPQEHRARPHPLLLGKSPRYALQTLGTEWRNYIGKALWANITLRVIKDRIAQGETRFVIDDMRFPHEADIFFEIGGYTMAIRRPSAEPSKQQQFITNLPWGLRHVAAFLTGIQPLHASEALWYRMHKDIEIYNSKGLDDLRSTVDDWVEQILEGTVP